jgi:signal transduction histidine kinase
MNLKKLLFSNENNHPELITLFATNVKAGSLPSNVITPLLFIYILSDYIDHMVLGVWLIVNYLIAFARIKNANFILKESNEEKQDLLISIAYILTILTAVLWSFATLMTYLYAPSLYLFFVTLIILGFSAGSITTLTSIFRIYVTYVLVLKIPLIIEFILVGEKMFYIASLLEIAFIIFVLFGGYKYYNKLKESLILKDKLSSLNENLEQQVLKRTDELNVLNESLEVKIKEEIENSRKKDQQLLEHSRQAQMGEMISMIAHQWRQPLGAISATSIDMKMKLMFNSYDLSKEDQKDEFNNYLDARLTKIEEFVGNLTQTIDDFRNFYKPNKDKKSVTINEPIKKSLNIIRDAANSRGIKIIENYNAQKVLSLYDNELMQVFLNIFKNAQDNFVEKNIQNAKIVINTEDRDDSVYVEILDNGGGIPEEILSKIFDPYFSTKNEKNGTGLGLYMSKMIVEDHHNGTINVKNSEEGACFMIEIQR